MDNPLVSILIPNYNKEPYIRETLNSVLAQTYTNWECIIVDDHSTDNSWEILKEYSEKDSRFKIYKRPDHLLEGGNACRNYAFELSKGEFVNWFDSDDVMAFDFIDLKVKRLIVDSSLDFVICDLLAFKSNVDNSFRYKNLDLTQTGINYPLRALIGDFWIGTPLPVFRKSYLEEKGLFNLNLKRGQEAEFFSRILLSEPNFVFEGKTNVFWRQSEESKTFEFVNSNNEKKSILTLPAHILIFNNFLRYQKLDLDSEKFFKKVFTFHLKHLSVYTLEYMKLLYFLYFKFKVYRKDVPLKIFFRRLLRIENWQ